MAKGPDWNDVHRANPSAVRDALTEPDIPFDDAPAAQPGNGEAYVSEEELRGKREPLEVNSEATISSYTDSPISNGHANNLHPKIDPDQIDGAIQRGVAADKGGRRGGRNARPAPQVVTRRASDIKPEPISWLWKYWLARGKLHIIAGVPETGKTTIALSYAAIVSSGGAWPDGTRAPVGSVLIWTAEDDARDTLVPRLMRMGADLDRIHFIEEAIPAGAKSRPFNPATDMPALVEKAKAIGDVALLILDPVVAAMPMTRNSHNNAESRNGMQPVIDFAKASDTAVIGIGHLAKGTVGKDPLERINGSGAFGALPRLVMGAAKNEADGENKPERIMVRIKSNIGPSGGGFGYHIDTAPLLEQPDIEATRLGIAASKAPRANCLPKPNAWTKTPTLRRLPRQSIS